MLGLSTIRRLLFKESAVGRMIAKFAVGRAVFPGRDFANFAKEAYQLNIIAYRCIEIISTAAASVPWLLYNDDKEIEEHEVLTLLKRPNPSQSGKEYFTAAYAYDLLAGNCYQERVMVGGNKTAKELYALRPDRMKVIPGKFGLPQAYEYTVNSEKMSFEVDPVTGVSDVLHVKRFNPLNDWYGQSPLEALGMSVDSHNEATRWNYAVLKNGARPSGAMEYEGDMDDDNFTRLKGEIEENYSGGKRGRPMLLQGGLKWVQMMLTQMEMDWREGKAVSAGEIAIGYNVPEQLVGVKGQQTYNNYREARMALYEDAVLPLLDRYSEALTNWFQSVPGFEGLRLGYDQDSIPALAPRRESLWDKVQGADFLTIDEKRNALGYEEYKPDDSKPGSMIFVSASEIPLSDAGLFSAPTDTAPQLDENGNPVPQLDSSGKPLPATGGPVQDLALNGAQIQAVVQIVQNVADGLMPPESAVQLLRVAFPSLDEAAAHALIDPAESFEPTPPPAPVIVAPGGQPGQPPRKPAPGTPQVRKHVMQMLLEHKARRDKELLEKAHHLAYGKK